MKGIDFANEDGSADAEALASISRALTERLPPYQKVTQVQLSSVRGGKNGKTITGFIKTLCGLEGSSFFVDFEMNLGASGDVKSVVINGMDCVRRKESR